IRASSQTKYIILDAAQEFAHVPTDLSAIPCDFYFTGTHKWLGAHQPLAIALLPNEKTARDVLQLIKQVQIAESLISFLFQLYHHCASPLLETVNLAPLFSAWGAFIDFHRCRPSFLKRYQNRLNNARRVCALVRSLRWTPLRPAPTLCSGILLLR